MTNSRNTNPAVDDNAQDIDALENQNAMQAAKIAELEARVDALEDGNGGGTCPPTEPPPTEPPPPEYPPQDEDPQPVPETPTHELPPIGETDHPYPDRHPVFEALLASPDRHFAESFRPDFASPDYWQPYYGRHLAGNRAPYDDDPRAHYDMVWAGMRKLTLKYDPVTGEQERALQIRHQTNLKWDPLHLMNAPTGCTLVYELRQSPTSFSGGKILQTAGMGNGRANGRIKFEVMWSNAEEIHGPYLDNAYSFTPDPRYSPAVAVNIEREVATAISWRIYKTEVDGHVGGMGTITPMSYCPPGSTACQSNPNNPWAGAVQPGFPWKSGDRSIWTWDDHGVSAMMIRSDEWLRVWEIHRWDTTPWRSVEIWMDSPSVGYAMRVVWIHDTDEPFPLHWADHGRVDSDNTIPSWWVECNNSLTPTPRDGFLAVRNFVALRGHHRPADYGVPTLANLDAVRQRALG